jgi:diguanylate cyclase (GGDEF)-like protein
MLLAKRYALLGALMGLLAPAGLIGYALTRGDGVDVRHLSVVLAAGGVTAFALLGRTIGRRDDTLRARNAELAALSSELRQLARVDALTGVANRRTFDERLEMELARARRYGVACSLIMIDLDRFKAVNDRYGHQAGDQVLRTVAASLDTGKRAGDLVARYGGEEFAAILPHTDADAAAAWAERLRARIAAAQAAWHGGPLTITASFGVAAGDQAVSSADLIEAADNALYTAKRKGGNAVVVAPAKAPERFQQPAGASRSASGSV